MVLDKVIMGVDPGSQVTGFGIIQVRDGKLSHLAHGVIKVGSTADSHPLRLSEVFRETRKLIKQYLPDEMAVEAPFFGKNIQSMLKLGRVQGVIMAAAMAMDIPVVEYAPLKVKKAITGKGQASKAQVAAILPSILPELKLQPGFEFSDASDALAIALCHYYQSRLPELGTKPITQKSRRNKAGAWDSFVKANPDKLVK